MILKTILIKFVETIISLSIEPLSKERKWITLINNNLLVII